MTVEELAEYVIDHMEFCGMDSQFYLPDPLDPSCLCYILLEDSEFTPTSVVQHI